MVLLLLLVLLLLFSGTEINNSEQKKIVSAAEPAPANDEHMQGTRHTLVLAHDTVHC
jgi:hypothetical protein